jgi:hypothetical protein
MGTAGDGDHPPKRDPSALAAVPRLALSQRPAVGTPRFLGAVARIASRTGAHPNRLAALLEWTAP